MGKRDELKRLFKENQIELVLIDGPVTPVQQRNLEKAWSVKILDRTGLILEIFSDRAATREGVLQVEMAALTYQRTRLVRAWTHLERQRGGLGFVGGPGETQIEADRRAIDLQLSKLRQQLSKVVKTRALHRASRAKDTLSHCRFGGIHKCWEIDIVQYSDRGGCGCKRHVICHIGSVHALLKDATGHRIDPL